MSIKLRKFPEESAEADNKDTKTRGSRESAEKDKKEKKSLDSKESAEKIKTDKKPQESAETDKKEKKSRGSRESAEKDRKERKPRRLKDSAEIDKRERKPSLSKESAEVAKKKQSTTASRDSRESAKREKKEKKPFLSKESAEVAKKEQSTTTSRDSRESPKKQKKGKKMSLSKKSAKAAKKEQSVTPSISRDSRESAKREKKKKILSLSKESAEIAKKEQSTTPSKGSTETEKEGKRRLSKESAEMDKNEAQSIPSRESAKIDSKEKKLSLSQEIEPRQDIVLNLKRVDSKILDGATQHMLVLAFPKIRGGEEKLLVYIPYRKNQTTSSIFSAFVVYTTYCVMYELDSRSENTLYDVMLRSQRLAYALFTESREWNGNASEKPDRVSSMLYWHFANGSDFFTMLDLGLAQPSDSDPDHDAISPFHITLGTERSNPVSSSAGLVMMRKKFDGAPLQLIMAATASGSVRTVEAVSTTILRMLWLDEDPGAAVCAPSVYHDYRDEKCYCDKGCKITSCRRVPAEDLEARDRIVMAIRRRSINGVLTAATDDRDPDFNYAVGY
ncbi:unnamed protein product [Haemonchus placei]|uniref:Peptidase_S9 domain-containing protein n=1 Tax=Haemonchus placei TaxID=6290 RepID=A0A158QPU1_HAEPC|nr:unnamed protein product [Haemonchus placei]